MFAGRIALRPAGSARCTFAIVWIAMTIVGYPLLALLAERPWTTAETFGVAPDPTALVTVAVLALAAGRIRFLLLAIPLIGCAIGALTLWAMDQRADASLLAGGALLALWPAIRGTPGGDRDATP